MVKVVAGRPQVMEIPDSVTYYLDMGFIKWHIFIIRNHDGGA